MKVNFYNLNNNDNEHEIIFLSLTTYANGQETITVLFDGIQYSAPVIIDHRGKRSFKRAGKIYDFTID